MERFKITGKILRFPGKGGWHYLPFGADLSATLRPRVTGCWPALLKASATIEGATWTATIMPIKDGPLFVAFPARIRKKLHLTTGDPVTVEIQLPKDGV